MDRVDNLPENDEAFNFAFDHFIRIRGWSIQEFARQTTRLSVDGKTRLIHPHQVTKWRRDEKPSTRAVMITCGTLEVPRSFFYFVGEELQRLAELEKDPERRGLRMVREAVASLAAPSDLDLLNHLEVAVRDQKARIVALAG